LTEALIITTEPRDDHQLNLTIQLGPERTEQALRRAAKLVAKKAKIPGFRPGRAPYGTILHRFGRETLLSEIMDDLGQEVYKEALETQEFKPYGEATLEDVKTDPVTFKLVVPLLPEVALGDYRSIRLEAPEVNVGEADVDELLERAREERATWQTVERAAEVGDTVVMDIHGTVGDNTIMDNQDWELILKEESGWLPGFDNAFVGMAAGDEKTFTLTYPEDSASRYKGQEATFQATVKEVKARVRPELDDEFARSLGDYEDMADLRTKLLSQLTEQRTKEAENKLHNEAIEALIEHATLAYPPKAVDNVVQEMLSDTKQQVAGAGYSLEDYLRLQGMTPERYASQLRPAAEKRLQGRLVLGELIKAEQITVTPDENDAELEKLVQDSGGDDQAKSLRQFLGSAQGKLFIEQDLLTRKALARLREIVTGQAPDLTAAIPEQDGEAETAAEAGEIEEASPGEEPANEAVEEKEEA